MLKYPVVLSGLLIAAAFAFPEGPSNAETDTDSRAGDTPIATFSVADLQGPMEDRAECRHDSPRDSIIPLSLRNGVDISEIPEFNDCQPFVDGNPENGATYEDGLFAIFASAFLDSLEWDIELTARPGANDSFGSGRESARTAAVFSFGRSAQLPSGGELIGVSSTRAAAAATIYNESGKEYKPLGIKPGFNCLVLRVQGQFRARMVSVPSAKACKRTIEFAEMPKGVELAVKQTVPAGNEVPPVARWDWDPSNRIQYIGIRCGRAWCEIGRKRRFTFTPWKFGQWNIWTYFWVKEFKPSWHFQSSDPNLASRLAPKGWYDEQALAIQRADGELVPDRAIGTIIPAADLGAWAGGEWTEERWRAIRGSWKLAAYLALHGSGASNDYPTAFQIYREKLRMRGTAIPFETLSNPNQPFALDSVTITNLEYCLGTRQECEVPEVAAGGPSDPPHEDPAEGQPNTWYDPNNSWWARFVPPGGDAKYTWVTRRRHLGVEIPATARWRWVLDDETIWTFCPEGCCEVRL
jgi:hypothetical protein